MLRIGELAREAGESVRTLRYWEGEGLLTAERSDSGYRLREHLADVRKRLRDLRALERELAERMAWAEANPDPECSDGCVYLTPAARARPSGEPA